MTARRRAILWQAVAAFAVIALLLWIADNTVTNMARRNISFGFGFLLTRAGFDIPFHLLDWDAGNTYGRALLVSGVNSLFAAALIIVAATLLGLVVALMRLSGNPLAAGTARVFVEIVRNTPQLTQVVFFYFAVLQVLPQARQSFSLRGVAFLNVRGLYVPAPVGERWQWIVLATLLLVLAAALLWQRLGIAVPRLIALGPALVAGCALAVGAAGWDIPALRGFNFTGGARLPPELLALWLGISLYTSAFIAEIIRASILGIQHGQTEAGRSLGLSSLQSLALVILPQALRTLIPPLTSQYLNIIKSTTLGAAIAYPEVLQIFARTVLNQSGRAVEVMTLVLGVFLVVNLTAAGLMNAWNRRLALRGR